MLERSCWPVDCLSVHASRRCCAIRLLPQSTAARLRSEPTSIAACRVRRVSPSSWSRLMKHERPAPARRNAAANRRELIAARLNRRDLMKMGLLTSTGYLVVKNGLSARADGNPQSPPTRAFVEPLPIMPVKQPVAGLSPAPTVAPNTAAGEGRTRSHQALARFPPRKLYEVHQKAALVSMSPDLPLQTIWGFDGLTPGPTYIARYGEPILVRNFNDLPADNAGFGLNEVSTHQHNGHTPSESDGC